jgi:hypothetical protein
MGHLMAKQELFHRNFVFIGVKGGSCLVAGLLSVCKGWAGLAVRVYQMPVRNRR